MKQALQLKELEKCEKYGDECQRNGYKFIPMGFHLWGGVGPQGGGFLNRIIRQLVGDSQGWVKSQKTSLLWHRVSCALMKGVAAQLLPGTAIVPSQSLPQAKTMVVSVMDWDENL